MPRLNSRALEILRIEILRCTGNDPILKVQQDILLRRLEKLRSQEGSPVSSDELRNLISDILPNFSEKVLKSAVKANQPSPILFKVILGTAGLIVGSTGLIWVANLPYPMIRWPVAKVAPIILLPSYISMDHNYRGAIASVEQADQFINHATSIEDILQGEKKTKVAQKHLDALPVWFLGYWPRYYCQWFSCSWQFTLDEFKSARANVARMEAKVFQEKNAEGVLNQVEQGLNTAKQQYQQGTAETKQKVLAAWQAALDQLEQIPSQTLAGRKAQTKLTAYKRDFQEVSGLVAGNSRTNTLIAAAKEFALMAAKSGLNPPHTATEWQQIIILWQQAIKRLEDIPLEDPGYIEAQKLLATYQTNVGIVETRLQAEKQSIDALESAQNQIKSLLASIPTDAALFDRNRIISQLQGIINQLESVPAGTTASAKAQELLQSAQNKLKQLQP